VRVGRVICIYGRKGNDQLAGGPDTDYIYGGPGRDLIYGESGDDTISTIGTWR